MKHRIKWCHISTMSGFAFVVLILVLVLSGSTGTHAQVASPTTRRDAHLEWIIRGPDGYLWFTEVKQNTIGRLTTAGRLVGQFVIPPPQRGITDMVTGSDGNVWFGESKAKKIGRLTPSGILTEFALTGNPYEVTAGPGNTIWFTEPQDHLLGRITLDGQVREFPLLSHLSHYDSSYPSFITLGPDDNLWFTEGSVDGIGQITPGGQVTEVGFRHPSNSAQGFIATGPDRNLWFPEQFADGRTAIARMTLGGKVTHFFLPGGDYRGMAITLTTGPDGNLWFGEIGTKIGSITPNGVIREFAIPGRWRDIFEGITAGPDGNMWFTSLCRNMIGRITVHGHLTTFYLPGFAHDTGGGCPLS